MVFRLPFLSGRLKDGFQVAFFNQAVKNKTTLIIVESYC